MYYNPSVVFSQYQFVYVSFNLRGWSDKMLAIYWAAEAAAETKSLRRNDAVEQ